MQKSIHKGRHDTLNNIGMRVELKAMSATKYRLTTTTSKKVDGVGYNSVIGYRPSGIRQSFH